MIQSLLSDPGFAIQATGLLVGAASALIGPFLILRRNAMLVDAISHSIVLGLVLTWLATGLLKGPVQIAGAALTGVVTALLVETLARSGRVKDDAAIGLVFPALFAGGVLLLNLYASDIHLDIHSVLLGEIGFVWLDTVSFMGLTWPRAVLTMAAVTLVNAVFVGVLWKELKLSTFDPVLARAFGFAPRVLFYLLLMLTSGTAVAAFDAVGAVLFIAFVIVPPAAAYLVTDRLAVMVVLGVAISAVSSVAGYALAVAWDVSIGGMMAVMTGVFLGLALVLGPRHGLIALAWTRARQRRLNRIRTLAIHLMTHEGGATRRAENVVEALRSHLAWTPAQAAAVLAQALARGYVMRQGEALHLTPPGRAMAQAVLEPWRRDGG